MQSFFKPKSWEKNTEALQFKSVAASASSSTSLKNNVGKKSKAKKKKQPGTQPVKTEVLATTATKPKILSGRIEKKTNKKKQVKKDQAKPTPQLSEVSAGVGGKLKKNKKKQSDKKSQDGTSSKVQSGRVEKKKNKLKSEQLPKLTPALATTAAIETTETTELSDVNELTMQLKQRLMGGRFRYLNEQLYTMDSKQAGELFRQEPEAFDAYHEGYRQQVEKWPLNPLNRIIKMVRRLPKTHEVGDFGCGDGRLAQSVPNKVYSLDLVASREDIIACDMAHTPLKAQTLDIAVYCLSLMGTNLHEYLLEANRVLKVGGLLLIAEIQSRFDADFRPFLRVLDASGFQLIKRDGDSKVFFFFQFKKVRDVGKIAKLPPITLKPCLYKKR